MTQEQAWTALGVSRATLQKMERESTTYARLQPVHRTAARLYGWTDDSPQRVLDGEDPIQSGEAPGRPPEEAAEPDWESVLTEGLSERARDALMRGKTVDTDVIDLAPDDPDASAVLIFKRGVSANVSPERKLADLRKWARLQRAAREIFSEEEPPSP
jgi:hypothetical protein